MTTILRVGHTAIEQIRGKVHTNNLISGEPIVQAHAQTRRNDQVILVGAVLHLQGIVRDRHCDHLSEFALHGHAHAE